MQSKDHTAPAVDPGSSRCSPPLPSWWCLGRCQPRRRERPHPLPLPPLSGGGQAAAAAGAAAAAAAAAVYACYWRVVQHVCWLLWRRSPQSRQAPWRRVLCRRCSGLQKYRGCLTMQIVMHAASAARPLPAPKRTERWRAGSLLAGSSSAPSALINTLASSSITSTPWRPSARARPPSLRPRSSPPPSLPRPRPKPRPRRPQASDQAIGREQWLAAPPSPPPPPAAPAATTGGTALHCTDPTLAASLAAGEPAPKKAKAGALSVGDLVPDVELLREDEETVKLRVSGCRCLGSRPSVRSCLRCSLQWRSMMCAPPLRVPTCWDASLLSAGSVQGAGRRHLHVGTPSAFL